MPHCLSEGPVALPLRLGLRLRRLVQLVHLAGGVLLERFRPRDCLEAVSYTHLTLPTICSV
eukprot:14507961-Alexandrium_andersonii.AAC.1